MTQKKEDDDNNPIHDVLHKAFLDSRIYGSFFLADRVVSIRDRRSDL